VAGSYGSGSGGGAVAWEGEEGSPVGAVVGGEAAIGDGGGGEHRRGATRRKDRGGGRVSEGNI
jgi:hypothetical protein